MSLLGGRSSHRAVTAPSPIEFETFTQDRLRSDIYPHADRGFEFALDTRPCSALFCNRDLILRYFNRSSCKTLLSLQKHLPVPVDQIVGKSIHIFHKDSGRIDSILGNKHHDGKHQLPHTQEMAQNLERAAHRTPEITSMLLDETVN